MEYIFRFIEYINESSLFSIVTLVFIIGYLIMLYKKREDEDNYLGLKLVGFYFLGGFNFNFKMNWFILAIPVGFGIYYFWMKDKERPNATIKYKAALLGMIMMYVGTINGMIYERVEYREVTIKVENVSFDTLEEDYALIKNKLGINYADMKHIDLDYNHDGSIDILNYSLADDNKFYNIYYENNEYKINVTPAYDDAFWNSNVLGRYYEADEIFKMISNIGLNKYDNAISHFVSYKQDTKYYEDMEFYNINPKDYSTSKLEKAWAINDALAIEHNVFLNPTNEDTDTYKNEVYLINYSEIEYAKNYDEVVMESVRNNNSVVISDQSDLKDIYKRVKEEPFGWSPVTDLDITLKPDLYIKFSDESVVGLCEQEPFIRVDEDGVGVWYIGPSDLYTFMINKYFDASK